MTKSGEKYISKHPQKQELKEIIRDLSEKQFRNYDISKLQGHKNLFRLRKGKIRIIFSIEEKEVFIHAVDTRGDIYKGL